MAPSRSWVAANYNVFSFPERERYCDFKSDSDIVEVVTTTSGLDPFGTVSGGHIDSRDIRPRQPTISRISRI